jgi:hypothetical protein
MLNSGDRQTQIYKKKKQKKQHLPLVSQIIEHKMPTNADGNLDLGFR